MQTNLSITRKLVQKILNDIKNINTKLTKQSDKIDECFTSVSNGKELLASAITDKGVETDATATFEIMAENIANIEGSISVKPLVPILQSDEQNGYVSSASSVYNDSYPYKMFDKEPNTVWHSNSNFPQWVQIKFSTPKTIRSFSLTNRVNDVYLENDGMAVKNFKLQGSNDGVSFVDLGNYVNPIGSGIVAGFNVDSTDKYLYYRLYITSNWGHPSNLTNIVAWQLYGYEEEQMIEYSLEERRIGTWVDGKPLYQKTVNCGTLPNRSRIYIPLGVDDVDLVMSLQGIAFNYNESMVLPNITNTAEHNVLLWWFKDRKEICIVADYNRSGFTNSYVTARYTKTTD